MCIDVFCSPQNTLDSSTQTDNQCLIEQMFCLQTTSSIAQRINLVGIYCAICFPRDDKELISTASMYEILKAFIVYCIASSRCSKQTQHFADSKSWPHSYIAKTVKHLHQPLHSLDMHYNWISSLSSPLSLMWSINKKLNLTKVNQPKKWQKFQSSTTLLSKVKRITISSLKIEIKNNWTYTFYVACDYNIIEAYTCLFRIRHNTQIITKIIWAKSIKCMLNRAALKSKKVSNICQQFKLKQKINL